MGKIYDNVIQLIGNTPILHLHKMEEEEGLEANIYAKVEGFNPGGSVKDRAALNMIEAAEKEGKLKPGGRIVEGTSGNTGIGIALVSAVKNYHATICMQEGTSAEKIKILKAYGAEVELTPKNEGFGRAGGRAKEMEEEEGAFRPAQGENPHHPEAHILHTGPEIWRDLDGKVDLIDGVLLQKLVADQMQGNAQQLKNADTNYDQAVDGNDALVLLRFLTHLIDTLPEKA